jgi:HSP20 family molecular chaperone IbpA
MDAARKRELTTGAEDMRPGPVFSPAVDIFENENLITLLADMPGVEPGSLDIDLREGVLTLRGRVEPTVATTEDPVLSEWSPGAYFRQFTLSNKIDQGGIAAVLTDGVLRLTLPKVEDAKPRKVKVGTA